MKKKISFFVTQVMSMLVGIFGGGFIITILIEAFLIQNREIVLDYVFKGGFAADPDFRQIYFIVIAIILIIAVALAFSSYLFSKER